MKVEFTSEWSDGTIVVTPSMRSKQTPAGKTIPAECPLEEHG